RRVPSTSRDSATFGRARSSNSGEYRSIQYLEGLVAAVGVVIRARENHQQPMRGNHENEVAAIAPGKESRLIGARHEHLAFPPQQAIAVGAESFDLDFRLLHPLFGHHGHSIPPPAIEIQTSELRCIAGTQLHAAASRRATIG